jgi:predicted ATP-dependent Lon-type protease
VPALLFPGYLPGWEVPKLTPESFSRDYGFITVYFCEIMAEDVNIKIRIATRH